MINPILSVIVPIYNASSYLCRCIDSILNNVLPASEIILVNDGSTDNSGELCDKYAKSNSCIRVIHQPNGGLSDARNLGLKQATGEYIHFVDADDFVLDGIYEYFKDNMLPSHPDIVCFDFIKDADISEKVKSGEEVFFTCAHDALSRYTIRSYAWAKFWRRSFLENYKLLFFPKIYLEDVLFTWEALSYSGNLMYSSAKLYSYSTISGGMVLNRDWNHLQWTIESYITVNEKLKELADRFGNIKMVKNTFTYHYHVLFNRCLCSLYSYYEISRIFKKCSKIGIKHLTDDRQIKLFDFCYHHPFLYFIFHQRIMSHYFKRPRFNPSERDFIQLSEAIKMQKEYKRKNAIIVK